MGSEEQIPVTVSSEDGEKFDTTLTAQEIEHISSNDEAYHRLILQLRNKSLCATKKTLNLSEETFDALQEDNKQVSEESTRTTNIPKLMPHSSTSAYATKWNEKNIKLLLQIRLGMEDKFSKPTCKKNKLWEEISKIIQKEGYTFSRDDCNMKYRNLLQTYRQNKEKRLKSTGESKITWEYFEIFDSVLGTKCSSIPATDMPLDDDDFKTSLQKDEDLEDFLRQVPKKNEKPKVTKESKTNSMAQDEYLFLKNKRAIEKGARSEERWQEEKRLKIAEIEPSGS